MGGPRNPSTKSHGSVISGAHPDFRLSVSRGRARTMTANLDTELVPIQVLHHPARPQVKAVMVGVAASLVTAVVAPAGLFVATLVTTNV